MSVYQYQLPNSESFFRAVKEVFGDMYETFNVDNSRDMNDIHRMVLTKSFGNLDMPSGCSIRFQLPRDSAVRFLSLLSQKYVILLSK